MALSRRSGILLIILALLLVTACGAQQDAATAEQSEPSSDSAQQIDAGPTVLNFYNWDTYIDPNILSTFEEEFDVTINYQVYDDEEEMMAGLESGDTQYDLVVPSDFYVGRMREAGLLAPLNKDHIPNMANIDPAFINPVYDPGNRHCAPYQWGTVGIGYNQDAVGTIESWEDVFDPAHAGRVGLYDDYRTTMELTLLALGYSPNTTDRHEIDEAAQFLKDRANIIAMYHGDDGQDLLLRGELDVVIEWSGDVFQVMEESDDLHYVVPPEGSILWTDYICVPASSQHKELAEAFINYLLEPETGARLSTYTQYGSPNKASIALLDEEMRNSPAIYPPAEVRARLFPEVPVDPVTDEYYAQIWKEVLATVGQ